MMRLVDSSLAPSRSDALKRSFRSRPFWFPLGLALALVVADGRGGQSVAAEDPPTTPANDLPDELFVNPIAEGADPWVVRDEANDRYLWCFSDANRGIAIAEGSLTRIGRRHVVWRAPKSGPYSKEVWAPELHRLDDRWYVYFAASDGDNANHRAYVLQSETADPLGAYRMHGPLRTGDGPDRDMPNIWAIDMTVLRHRGHRYAVWSGWDAPGTDRQFLYIARMKSPTELTGPRVRLTDNDTYLWERIEPNENARGLHEGPQVFDAGGRIHLIYSCGASWLPTYKLGRLTLTGDDPLDPSAWTQTSEPVFQSTEQTYGVGHSCFVKSPDGSQWWHVFHAKRDREPGWRRAIHGQPMSVDENGTPKFGKPLAAGQPLARPSGEVPRASSIERRGDSNDSGDSGDFSYYGHQDFFRVEHDSIQLGVEKTLVVNPYRSGEKILWQHPVVSDVDATVTIDFSGRRDSRDAGLLFRCTGAAVGYDAQRGYFAGLIPRTNLIIAGKTDGRVWNELGRASTSIDVDRPQRLHVRMTDNRMTIRHVGGGTLEVTDDTYRRGRIGFRVVDTAATFTDWRLRSQPPPDR